MASENLSLVALEAEHLIKEVGIDCLPVDPIFIAKSLDIEVQPKLATRGVSGMLIRYGNNFGIGYATHINNEGFKRFSIAHEIGHYRLPGHIDAVLDNNNIHESNAGCAKDDPYEREADHFAATLLMPDSLFSTELQKLGEGLQAIEAMADRCIVSLTAVANRYIQKTNIPEAMIISTGQHIDYCFMSSPLKDFDNLEWIRKGQRLPSESQTSRFNSDPKNVKSGCRADDETNLRDWFNGKRNILGTEEVIGLGSYGKTLTILSTDIFADDEDEEENLENLWKVDFPR